MVYSTGRYVVCLSMCRFVLVFFGPFGVATASLREAGGGGGGGWSWCFSYVCSVCACLDLSVSSSSWGRGGGGGGAAVCDCGILWTFLLLFLKTISIQLYRFLYLSDTYLINVTFFVCDIFLPQSRIPK